MSQKQLAFGSLPWEERPQRTVGASSAPTTQLPFSGSPESPETKGRVLPPQAGCSLICPLAPEVEKFNRSNFLSMLELSAPSQSPPCHSLLWQTPKRCSVTTQVPPHSLIFENISSSSSTFRPLSGGVYGLPLFAFGPVLETRSPLDYGRSDATPHL